jgi:CRISPR/Cas system-associated exonuclease Cas4 (RecB family)
MLDETRLTGNLDKIEIQNDANEVVVIDYKTGRVKSRNEIEGDTKNADGNYKRQLVFYNLLLNGYMNGKYKMVSGEIDFIEPDDKGRCKKEPFVIGKEEIAELEALIKKVVDEILNLSFWDKRCGDKKCEFCQLRDLM